MKTLHCDYFTPKSLPTPDGEYWGVVGITNHSNEKQISTLTVFEYETGNIINKFDVVLLPKQSILLTNKNFSIIGRTRLYLDCSEYITATVGNTKGKTSAISWERMEELPFPKQ